MVEIFPIPLSDSRGVLRNLDYIIGLRHHDGDEDEDRVKKTGVGGGGEATMRFFNESVDFWQSIIWHFVDESGTQHHDDESAAPWDGVVLLSVCRASRTALLSKHNYRHPSFLGTIVNAIRLNRCAPPEWLWGDDERLDVVADCIHTSADWRLVDHLYMTAWKDHPNTMLPLVARTLPAYKWARRLPYSDIRVVARVVRFVANTRSDVRRRVLCDAYASAISLGRLDVCHLIAPYVDPYDVRVIHAVVGADNTRADEGATMELATMVGAVFAVCAQSRTSVAMNAYLIARRSKSQADAKMLLQLLFDKATENRCRCVCEFVLSLNEIVTTLSDAMECAPWGTRLLMALLLLGLRCDDIQWIQLCSRVLLSPNDDAVDVVLQTAARKTHVCAEDVVVEVLCGAYPLFNAKHTLRHARRIVKDHIKWTRVALHVSTDESVINTLDLGSITRVVDSPRNRWLAHKLAHQKSFLRRLATERMRGNAHQHLVALLMNVGCVEFGNRIDPGEEQVSCVCCFM